MQVVVLLEADTHVPLVLLVVLGDLCFTLLKDLDFKTSLARPLLPQIDVELLN